MTNTPRQRPLAHIDHELIAPSSTAPGILMAGLNGSVLLISLPDGDPAAAA